jgi:hypothetical protein
VTSLKICTAEFVDDIRIDINQKMFQVIDIGIGMAVFSVFGCFELF